MNDGRRLALLGAFALGAFALLYSHIPKVWVARAERVARPHGLEFTGALPTYADDCFTYWSWTRQARSGRFFFEDLYTTEEHPRNYVNVLFWGMGTASRITGASEERVYAAARVLFSLLLLYLLWKLAGKLFEAPFLRLTAFGFFVVQGGWAGVADVFERHWNTPHVTSPEWWTPEMNTVFSMMLFPHFLAGFCCMVGIVLLGLASYAAKDRSRRLWLAAGAGMVMTVLTFFHPYDVVAPTAALWLAPVLIGLVERAWPRREHLETAFCATIVWLPSVLYNAWLFSQNPAMRAWDLQNQMVTPEPSRLIISLGIGGALAAMGFLAIGTMSRPLLLMTAWFVSHLVLIHFPLRFQRRMIGGIQFPMGALAAFALAAILAPPIVRRLARSDTIAAARSKLGGKALGAAVLAMACVVFPFELAGPRRIVQLEWSRMRAETYPSWVRHDEIAAFDRLEIVRDPSAVIFCSYEMGGLVPPWTGHRTYLGHYALTIDSARKREEIRRFFSAGDEDDPWRIALLRAMGATHLLHTTHERNLGSFDPSSKPWLREIFRAGGDAPARAVVYEVVLDASPSP